MRGLLDGMDDPRTMGLLSLGLGLLGSRGSFGEGLAQAGPQALMAMRQVRQDQEQRAAREQAQKLQDLQMQQAQMALAESKRQQEQQAQMRALAQRFALSPQQMALAQGGGPTVANARAAQTAAPGFDFSGYANALAGIDPMASLNVQAALRKDAPKRAVVAPGASLVDEATGKPVFTAPKPVDYNQLIITGPDGKPMLNELFLGAKRQIARDSAARTNVTVDAGPKAFWTDLGKMAVDDFSKSRDSAQAAASVLQNIGEIRQAVQGGAYQGMGAELKLGAAKALGALGMPYDAATVANTEVFNARAKEFVLANIKQLGAAPTDADRKFLEQTVPRLQTDPKALPLLLTFMEGKARQQIASFNDRAAKVQSQPQGQFLPFDLTVKVPDSGADLFGTADAIIKGGR